MSRKNTCEEILFDVPYGELFAKTWGEDKEGCKRVLALHGWMDNSGSFDKLLPLLKHDANLFVVALDLPGHGKSSQFLPGASYTDLALITEVRRVIKDLHWDRSKFSILGHSYGGCLGMYYCSLFPDDVDELVLLDYLKFNTTEISEVQRWAGEACDRFIDVVPSQPLVAPAGGKPVDKGQVVVSQEAAIVATIDAHKKHTTLTPEDAACLLVRSTVAINSPPNSVIYNRDLRLNCMLNVRESWGFNLAVVENIKCNVFCILSKDGLYTRDALFKDKMDEMQEFLRAKCRSFHTQWMEADHYLHMNKSKETSDIINNYWKCPLNYQVVA